MHRTVVFLTASILLLGVNRLNAEPIPAEAGDEEVQEPEQSSATAWYTPATGEFVIEATNVTSWLIDSHENLMTGADSARGPHCPEAQPGDNGPLPLAGGLVTDNDRAVGEATIFVQFSYGPISLGRIAEPGLPVTQVNVYDFFELPYTVGLSMPVQYGEINVIPEPGTLAMLFGGALAGLAVVVGWRRRRAP